MGHPQAIEIGGVTQEKPKRSSRAARLGRREDGGREEIVRAWGAGVLRPYEEAAMRWRMRRRQKIRRRMPMRIRERLRPTQRPRAPQWRREQSQAPSGKPISQ